MSTAFTHLHPSLTGTSWDSNGMFSERISLGSKHPPGSIPYLVRSLFEQQQVSEMPYSSAVLDAILQNASISDSVGVRNSPAFIAPVSFP